MATVGFYSLVILRLQYSVFQSNLSVTVEVEDVNSSPYFDNVETELSVIEVTVDIPPHWKKIFFLLLFMFVLLCVHCIALYSLVQWDCMIQKIYL